jgi:hypothetical protein
VRRLGDGVHPRGTLRAVQSASAGAGDDAKDGRYFVDVPGPLANSADGFSYYAVLRDDSSGASITVPAGGTDAPQVSVPLRDARSVTLGGHRLRCGTAFRRASCRSGVGLGAA